MGSSAPEDSIRRCRDLRLHRQRAATTLRETRDAHRTRVLGSESWAAALWPGMCIANAPGRSAQSGRDSRSPAALRASARDHARSQRQTRTSARRRTLARANERRHSMRPIAAATSPITAPAKSSAIPILDLTEHRRDVRWYVNQLEEIMIRASADFGVTARRVADRHGIWVGTRRRRRKTRGARRASEPLGHFTRLRVQCFHRSAIL